MDKVDNFKIFKNNQEIIVGIIVDKDSRFKKRAPVRALFMHLIDLPIPQKVIPSLD